MTKRQWETKARKISREIKRRLMSLVNDDRLFCDDCKVVPDGICIEEIIFTKEDGWSIGKYSFGKGWEDKKDDSASEVSPGVWCRKDEMPPLLLCPKCSKKEGGRFVRH